MIYYFPPLLWLYCALGVTHYVWGAILTALILAFVTEYGRKARSAMSVRRATIHNAWASWDAVCRIGGLFAYAYFRRKQ